jgi:hypothetical protein
MPNPWDIPVSAPLRPGNQTPDDIYLAVGRALTKWEGLEAEMSALFAVVTSSTEQRYYVPATQAYGAINGTAARAEMIAKAAEAFFLELRALVDDDELRTDLSTFEAELKEILAAYRGWAARRNDIAHGYVTESQHPDYAADRPSAGGPPVMATTYSLCPSHGNSRKWHLITVQPQYHYIATEIDQFADAFDNLGHRVSDFSARLDWWRRNLGL